MHPHPARSISRLLLGAAVAASALGGMAPVQAQDTGSLAPSWSAPVDDVTGRPAHVTPIGQATPAATHAALHAAASQPASGARPSAAVPPSHTEMIPIAPLPKYEPRTSESPIAWDTGKNTSLMKAVAEWAHRAGWRVLWRSSTRLPVNDRRLDAPLHFTGDFQSALKHLFELYKGTAHPFTVDSYPQQLPPLIVITEIN